MKSNELPEGAFAGASWADSGLGQGPEVFHAPVMRSGSKQIIGMSALAVVVVGAAVVYFLAGGSPDRRGSGQITAPPMTAAPRAWPVLPGVPASAVPVTPAVQVTTPPAPVNTVEVSGSPAAPVMTPAAPKTTEFAPSRPSHRSAGGTTEQRAAVAPVPHTTGPPGDEDLRQGATSQNQPPRTAESPPAAEGWTRVPSQPWKPQGPR